MHVAVYNHFNARKICDVDVDAPTVAKLAKPPTLKSNRPEDHVVEIATLQGPLRLFPACVNGADIVVTNTPNAALSIAVYSPIRIYS